jgi:hypothetical protein
MLGLPLAGVIRDARHDELRRERFASETQRQNQQWLEELLARPQVPRRRQLSDLLAAKCVAAREPKTPLEQRFLLWRVNPAHKRPREAKTLGELRVHGKPEPAAAANGLTRIATSRASLGDHGFARREHYSKTRTPFSEAFDDSRASNPAVLCVHGGRRFTLGSGLREQRHRHDNGDAERRLEFDRRCGQPL